MATPDHDRVTEILGAGNPAVPFQMADGAGETSLADYRGKVLLVNFWATWCAPCRKEMPMLSELQTEFGGDHFEVITIATGRNSPQGIKKFFDEIEVGVIYVNKRSGATTGAWPGAQPFTGWKASGSSGKGGCGPYYVMQFMREQSRCVIDE